jgi:alpha-L-fucosidase
MKIILISSCIFVAGLLCYNAFSDKGVLEKNSNTPFTMDIKKYAMPDSVPWDDPVDNEYKHASEKAYERFRDWKYGIRIHWGVYCVDPVGIESESASWPLYYNDLDFQGKYHQKYLKFNPTEFDASEWMKLFERTGIKYFTFTAKHHDGFSMWDTKTRVKKRYVFSGPNQGEIEDCDLPYSIMNTPFKRDIVRELCDAGRKKNIGVFLYFSHWDWYDADFRWSGIGKVMYEPVTRENDPAGYERFLKRYNTQIQELLSNYGKIDGFEFDCEPRGTYRAFNVRGVKDWTYMWPDIKKMVKMARKIQPDALFRERGIGSYGDFHTPEGNIPSSPDNHAENESVKVWQVIYPVAGASWKADASYNSAEWMLSSLIDITAKGGNFQVGFGPMPNGKFDPRAIERLEYVGKWLKVNDEGIYKTRPRDGSLWKEGNDLRFTRSKDHKYIYALCLKWPGTQLIIQSVKPNKGSQIRMLGYAKPLIWTQSSNGIEITLPDELQKEENRPCKQAYVFKINGK